MNARTTVNPTIKLDVDMKHLAQTIDRFFTTDTDAVMELLQNARRAEAKHISVTFDVRTIVIQDDGMGGNLQDFVTIGGTNWTEYTQDEEDPAGLGFFACFKLAERVEIISGGFKVDFTPKNLISGANIPIIPVPENLVGTRITIDTSKDILQEFVREITKRCVFFQAAVTINGMLVSGRDFFDGCKADDLPRRVWVDTEDFRGFVTQTAKVPCNNLEAAGAMYCYRRSALLTQDTAIPVKLEIEGVYGVLRLKPESEVRLRLPDRHQVLDNDAWDQAKARLQAELVRRLEELKLQEWVEAAGGLKCKYVYQCPPKHLEVLEHLGSYGDIEYVKVPALQNWCEEQQERNLLIFPPGRYQFYIHGLSMFDQSQTGFKMDGSLHLQFQLMSQFHGRVFTIPGKWPIHAGKSPWAQRLVKRVDVEETQLDAHFLVFTLMDGTKIRELIEEPYMTEWNHDTREDCFYVPEGYKGGVPAWMDGAIRYATCDDDNSSERAERTVEEVYQTFERCLGQYNPAHYVRGYVADLAYRSGIDRWVREVEETSEEIIVRFKRPEAK